MAENTLQQFFEKMRQFQTQVAELAEKENRLLVEKDRLKDEIENASAFKETTLRKDNPLHSAIEKLQLTIREKFKEWDNGVEKALPMQALAQAYQNKIIFLVFGKVNAGKSSFTNQVVDLYRSLFPTDVIRHFYFSNDEIKDLEEAHFQEGCIETTVQIQGVELGDNFVLLDSPGLHSVVEKNGNLTRQFIDSADAVLWLTPSTSPGQTQELEDLRVELNKGKPLLPVITRSDKLEPEWDDEKGAIVRFLVNKDPDTRRAQEQDVLGRLQAKAQELNLANVEAPISISVHTYKQKQSDLSASGLARLFGKMSELVGHAGKYKTQKAQKMVENFLKSNVKPSLTEAIKPQIIEAKEKAEETIKRLENKQELIANKVINHISTRLFDIVLRHKASRDKQKILMEINQLLNQKLSEELHNELSEFISKIDNVSASLEASNISDFKDNKIRYEQVKGSSKQTLATSGAAAIGGAIGTVFGGPLGGIAGAAIGGLLGSKAGSLMVETEWVEESVGVLSEDLESSLKVELNQRVPKVVRQSIGNLINQQIKPLQYTCEQIENKINDFIRRID